MKIQLAHAQEGREWIRHSFVLFKKQPFELLLLLVSLVFMKLIVSLIPYLGEVLPFIIAPALSIGFMNASREVDENKKFRIGILLSAFRTPQIRSLLILGFVYTVAFYLTLACSIPVDQGALWKHALGIEPLTVDAVKVSGVALSAFIVFLIFMPFTFALWFTAPLIAWQNMGIVKAIFYSVVAVWRSKLAFIVYLFSWVAIVFFCMFVFGIVASLIPALSGILQTFVLLPAMIAMSVILQCSFYTSYRSLFYEKPTTIDELV